jgi:hypothetical protein
MTRSLKLSVALLSLFFATANAFATGSTIDGQIEVDLYRETPSSIDNADVTVAFDANASPMDVQWGPSASPDQFETDNCPANPLPIRLTGPKPGRNVVSYLISAGSQPPPCDPNIPYMINQFVRIDDGSVPNQYKFHADAGGGLGVSITIKITIGAGGQHVHPPNVKLKKVSKDKVLHHKKVKVSKSSADSHHK